MYAPRSIECVDCGAFAVKCVCLQCYRPSPCHQVQQRRPSYGAGTCNGPSRGTTGGTSFTLSCTHAVHTLCGVGAQLHQQHELREQDSAQGAHLSHSLACRASRVSGRRQRCRSARSRWGTPPPGARASLARRHRASPATQQWIKHESFKVSNH